MRLKHSCMWIMDGPYLKGFLDPIPNTIINGEMSLIMKYELLYEGKN